MEFNPSLDKANLLPGQLTSQNLSVLDTEHSVHLAIFRMNMGNMVLPGIEKEHADDQSVKHRNNGHRVNLLLG